MKYDKSTLCRTCLSNSSDLTPIANTIFIENHATAITIKALIKECASVEICSDDLRPQSICKLCMENARITYVFRKTCRDSELILSQQEANATIANIIECPFGTDDHFSSEDEKPLASIVMNIDSTTCGPISGRSKVVTKTVRVKRYKAPKSRIRVKSFAKIGANGGSYINNCEELLLHVNDESKDTISTNVNENNLLSLEEIDEFKVEDGNKYACPICNRRFTVHKSFTFHLKRHDDSKWKHKFADTFPIKTENSNSDSSDLLLLMSDSKDNLNAHLCPICNKSFSELKYLQRHVRRHQASGRLSIRNFNKKLNHQLIVNEKLTNLSKRGRKNIIRQQLACDICKSPFAKRTFLKEHLQKVHNISKMPSKCCYCNWTGGAAELAKHKEEHSEFKNFQCDYCEKKFFNKKSLQIHILIHTGEKKHMCHYCGKSFAVKHNLKMHIRTHTGEKPYKCTMCEKTFAQKSEVTVHMITHSEDRNYVCSVCGVTCRRKGALRDHLRSHLPIDEWDKCNVCGKPFRTKEQLKDHMHQHTGERNHVCNVCGKDYGRRRNLRTHIKMIHSVSGVPSPHICTVCGKSFTQKHVLSTHMKTHKK